MNEGCVVKGYKGNSGNKCSNRHQQLFAPLWRCDCTRDGRKPSVQLQVLDVAEGIGCVVLTYIDVGWREGQMIVHSPGQYDVGLH